MAIFRIEKTKNYTVMSNHHLRNTELSLKAKGLLSQILSLPENWDYTLMGLSRINRESVDAIRTAVHELERAGYITRSRERKENGQLGGAEYVIREQPLDGFTPVDDKPPIFDPPTQEKPISENPTLGKTTQLNKDIYNTYLSNTDSIPFPSLHPSPEQPERKGTEGNGMDSINTYRKIIESNIEYPVLIEQYRFDKERIDGLVDLMLETVCTSRKIIRIAGDDYPAELVKAKFLKLNFSHIEFVLECMKNNATEIHNIKKYLLAVLFNASTTIDSYYTAHVAYDKMNGFCAG